MKNPKLLYNFFLMVIFCIPLYLIKVSFFGLPMNIFEILALTVSTFAVAWKRKTLLKTFRQLPALFLLSSLLIIAGVLISIFSNNNIFVGLGIIKGWFLIPMFFSFAFYTTINSEGEVWGAFNSLYFSAVAVGLISIFYKVTGLVTYDNRLSAFYASPNHLAMYLAPAVFFGLYFLFNTYIFEQFSKKFFFYATSLLLVLMPLYYTFSYGAWLAIFLSLMIISTLILRTIKNKGVFMFLLLVSFAILVASQINTKKFLAVFSFSERSSSTSRTMIWQSATLLIKQNPVAGIGPGNFQESYLSVQKHFPLYLEWAVPQPHNIFLAFWLQASIFGLIGFVGLLLFVFQKLFQLLSNKKSVVFVTPLLGFFLYTIFHGLIDTTYWKNDLSLLFWLCVFLVLSLNSFVKKSQS